MTLFLLPHVPPAGFPHYGLDKAGGLLVLCTSMICVRVCVCRGTCSRAKETSVFWSRCREPILRVTVAEGVTHWCDAIGRRGRGSLLRVANALFPSLYYCIRLSFPGATVGHV